MGQCTVHSAALEVHYARGTHWRAQLGFVVISTDLVMEENISPKCAGSRESVKRSHGRNMR